MNGSSERPVVFLMGPTATGKSDVAVELLEHFNMEIVSVDSALVYRGLDIGTAKPPKKILEQAPHRLVDICEPTESYSAARFRTDAIKAIEEIESAGNIPILTGGTGLYFRALESGLSQLPSANKRIRHRLEQRCKEEGLQALYADLQQVDPVAASRISQNDPQRITRALEVFQLTGQAMSLLQKQGENQALQRNITKIALIPSDRDVHRQYMKERFLKMLEDGLVQEVTRFYKRDDISASLPSMRMVGYRQIWNYLDNSIDYEAMVNHAIVATRQLAKRQLTWLRKENNLTVFDSNDSNKLNQVINHIRNTY